MTKDNIYQIFIKKINLNSFNIFIFIYFKILKKYKIFYLRLNF